jgi:hypothetical protein
VQLLQERQSFVSADTGSSSPESVQRIAASQSCGE